MIAVPGDTSAATIAGIIADEAAIGMVNQKTTAVRLIPVIERACETVEFGGLLGHAPIMPVNSFSCEICEQDRKDPGTDPQLQELNRRNYENLSDPSRQAEQPALQRKCAAFRCWKAAG